MIATVLLLAACDVAGARETAAGIVAADNAADIERVLGFYAPEAELLPPGEAEVKGPEAIRLRYERMFATVRPKIELRVGDVTVQGDLAILKGHNGGRLEAKDGRAGKPLDDDFVMMLRCDSGRWRITRLMWHPATNP